MEPKRLVRSRTDRMAGGVCGGLGAYVGIDPIFIRLFFVLMVFAEGSGVLLYLILWVILPSEDRVGTAALDETVRDGAHEIGERARELGDELREGVITSRPQAGLIIGAALIALGVFSLLNSLNMAWFVWAKSLLWPLLFIAAGAFLLIHRVRGD